MDTKDLIDLFGTNAKAARAIGYTRAAVGVWQKNGVIPMRTQILIQRITRGKLKADKAVK